MWKDVINAEAYTAKSTSVGNPFTAFYSFRWIEQQKRFNLDYDLPRVKSALTHPCNLEHWCKFEIIKTSTDKMRSLKIGLIYLVYI